MYGYIYLTTNLINGKKYIGLHKASEFEGKRYIGSGSALLEDVDKYGRKNFSVKMIEACDTFEKLEAAEIKHIAKHNAVNDVMYYNKASGGNAGGGYLIPSELSRQKMSVSAKMRGNCLTEEGLQRCTKYGEDNGFFGKHHAAETKQHLSEVHSGRVWINNGKINKSVFHEELNDYLNKGFVIGMKTKRNDTKDRIWIHNPTTNEKSMVHKNDLDTYLNSGWKCGVGKRINSPSSTTIE